VYYGSGTVDILLVDAVSYAAAGAHHGQHLELYDIMSKIRLCQSMHISLKNNPATFHHQI